MEPNRAVKLSIHVTRGESGSWIAGSPELDVYSQGPTPEEARRNAIEALNLFLDSTAEKGTLLEILRQSDIRIVEVSLLDQERERLARSGGWFSSLFHRPLSREIRTFPIPERVLAHS